MPTAVENRYVFAKLDELEPAPTGPRSNGRREEALRRPPQPRHHGVRRVGVQRAERRHRHQRARRDPARRGRPGGALHRPERRGDVRDRRRVGRGSGGRARQRAADGEAEGDSDRRRHDDPGRRRHSRKGVRARGRRKPAEAFAAYGAGDYEEALAKQLVVIEKQPDNPVAHFNVGCFAARAGHADQAIEALGRAVEINDRIKELMATDEDLDSIREDPRFVELAK